MKTVDSLECVLVRLADRLDKIEKIVNCNHVNEVDDNDLSLNILPSDSRNDYIKQCLELIVSSSGINKLCKSLHKFNSDITNNIRDELLFVFAVYVVSKSLHGNYVVLEKWKLLMEAESQSFWIELYNKHLSPYELFEYFMGL